MDKVIRLKCPNCGEELNSDLTCKNNHTFHIEDGVLIFLEDKFKSKLYEWLDNFHNFRSNNIDPLDFDNLPQSGLKSNRNIWKARIKDIELIKKELPNKKQRILEVGSWNGWLANSLTKLGNHVVAVDFFIHENDGLKSRNHYSKPIWDSIQMNIDQLSDFDEKFDLIIFNRCFAYLNNFNNSIQDAKKILKQEGKIIITGLNVSSKIHVTEELTTLSDQFKLNYNKNLLFNNSKGYFTLKDIEKLKSLKFQVREYPDWKNKLKALIKSRRNITYFAVYNS